MATKKTSTKTNTAAKPKAIKLEATSNLSGKYNLPYSIGQQFTIDEKRAAELLENDDAKTV